MKRIDDQRLAFWTKHSSEKEESNTKAQFEQAWGWVYSICSRRCLRQELITNFGKGELELRCLNECCTSCDIENSRDFNTKEACGLLLQVIVNLKPTRMAQKKNSVWVVMGKQKGHFLTSWSPRSYGENQYIFQWNEAVWCGKFNRV